MKQLALGLIILGLGAAPAVAESWHPFSRSPTRVYMADVDSITENAGVTAVRVATASRSGDPGDYSHTVETYEFQCGTRSKWRTAGAIEYGPDGEEFDRYPEEGSPWEDVRPNTSPHFLEQIVCDGARAQPPIWATVKEFVDAGRN